MRKNYIHIILFLWHGFVWANPNDFSIEASEASSIKTFVVSKDSTTSNPKDTTKLKKANTQQLAHLQQLATMRSSLLAPRPTNADNPKIEEAEEKVFRSFPSLDKKLVESQNFNVSFANREPEFNEAFLAENFQQNPAVDKLINNAKNALNAVAELGNFVDIITGNELLELPVGLKKTDQTSNNSVELAITEVKFTSGYALLKIWARLIIPEKGEFKNEKDRGIERELFFGAENVKLSHDGGLSGDMKLVLLGNQAIPIQGDNWLLTLKGGIDLKTGAFTDQSFIEFNCSDLKGISLEGDVRVSRNVLLPIDQDGNYTCGSDTGNQYSIKDDEKVVNNKCYVGASFKASANGWNDIFTTVNLPPFEVVGLKSWGFNMQNITLDFSDTRSAENMELPVDYNKTYPGEDLKLWRGFYAKEVSVMLPKGIENTKKSNGRVEFGAKNLVLDSQGVSGTFFGENVLKTGEGSAGKWAFTIDDVSISLSRNSLSGGSIGGDVSVPILKEPMGYAGYIAQDGYGLSAVLNSSYTAPVFLGEMQLLRNSTVGIDVKDGNVYPHANLTGKLAIAGKVNQKEGETPDPEDKNGFAFSGISFQELELQTEPGKKAIQAKAFGFNGEMNLMGFPASIGDLKLVTPNNQVGLSFDLKINLDDGGSHATTSMDILGKLNDGEKIQQWRFEKVKIDGIAIKYTKSNFTLEGSLKVMEDDPIYGDGFDGTLSATFKNPNFKVGGRAIFGKTEFRYWNVDVWMDNVEGNGDSKLPLKAFVGGISNRMKKTGGNASGFEPGTATYEPDANTGLAIRAGVKIQTQNSGSFSCKAYLEMEYNIHGGLNRIGFMGEGAIMGDGDGGSLAETGAAASKVGKALEGNSAAAANKRYGNYLSVAQESIPVHDVAASGKVGVYVGIERDFVNDTFDGEFELYLDLSAVKGGGANNLAGYAKIHTGPNDWYMYIGTPQQRIDLLFNSGVQVRVGGYFMTGTKLPPPGDISPHPIVTKILGDDIFKGERKDNQLVSGKGFAFGMNFGYGYGFDWPIFYASVEIGAGFDVMHAYYPNAKCVGRPGPVGNNGWYSMGQVYAYLYGEFGVKVDLAFIKGKFKIAEAGVAAALRGQFPNPVYIQGYVGMYYKILGGLVEGRMRMKVELGEECELEGISNTVGVPIISDLTPRHSSDDVSVFAAPQAVFNYAANSDFTVNLDEGNRTFKIQLKNFTVTSEGRELEGQLEWNDTNDAVTFKPVATLPSEKEVQVVVEVSFDEKIGGSYQTMVENGQPVIERSESTFMTDKAPDHIPLENIAYMYPVLEQKSFHPEEFDTGYVKLISQQNYLFESGFEMRAEFVSNSNGQGVRTNLSYDRSKATVFYDVPEMVLNSTHTLNLMAFPPGADIQTEIIVEQTEVLSGEEAGDTNWFDPTSGTQEVKNTSSSVVVSNKKAAEVTISNGAPKSILEYSFKTSKYATFGDKVGSLNVTDNLLNFIGANVHSMSIEVADYEYLEKLEILGGRYTASQPLVYGQAILDDKYYKKKIYPLIYEDYPLDGNIRVNREEDILGVPPIRSFYISNQYEANVESKPYSYWVKNRIPFVYDLPYQYKEDFLHLRNTVLSRYGNNEGDAVKYDSYRYLLEGFPAIPLGNYKSQLFYSTPGNLYQNGYDIEYVNKL
ncbi:hypothetical protein D9O36_11885 [Zobellia amurskyensis]|uniref:Uncharacterized protein n=1 Tax=Zobellia amurskyensis TaxID=248905 RepID=A0A7X3D2G6_9FLAO|nr:hypothetical protein [Zobellia amurskyensis]MUH36543.1 hypothetical protein [Zobellia amurskyensis]